MWTTTVGLLERQSRGSIERIELWWDQPGHARTGFMVTKLPLLRYSHVERSPA
jgi:hypothetical protein